MPASPPARGPGGRAADDPERNRTGTDLAPGGSSAATAGRGGMRRLLVTIGVGNAALYGLYGGVLYVLLPLQIEHIDRLHKVAVFGMVSGVSAIFAAVFNPIDVATPTTGAVAGVALSGQFTGHLAWGYLSLGGMLAVTAIVFVTATTDPDSADAPRRTRDGRGAVARLADFLSALRSHDFAWVFGGRAAMILGYSLVTGFELYILTDYVTLPAGMKPDTGVIILAAISTACSALAASVAGPLPDPRDRLRRLALTGLCLDRRLSRNRPLVRLSASTYQRIARRASEPHCPSSGKVESLAGITANHIFLVQEEKMESSRAFLPESGTGS